MKKKIILVGAGGHAKSCIDVINSTNIFKIIGFIDNKKKGKFENYKILGNDEHLFSLKSQKNLSIAITIGQIKKYKPRYKIFKKLLKLNFKLPKIISKFSIVSKKANISFGTMIFHDAIINRGSFIGKNTIINSKALIEHDTKIGDNSHIATSAVINGNVEIGANTFVGSRAVIKNGIKIGKNCVIGMGSVIKKDLKDYSLIN